MPEEVDARMAVMMVGSEGGVTTLLNVPSTSWIVE